MISSVSILCLFLHTKFSYVYDFFAQLKYNMLTTRVNQRYFSYKSSLLFYTPKTLLFAPLFNYLDVSHKAFYLISKRHKISPDALPCVSILCLFLKSLFKQSKSKTFKSMACNRGIYGTTRYI